MPDPIIEVQPIQDAIELIHTPAIRVVAQDILGIVIVLNLVVSLFTKLDYGKIKKLLPQEQKRIRLTTRDSAQFKVVKEALDEIRVIAQADRVVVGDFHNGGSVTAPFAKMKMSIVVESTSPRAKPITGLYQNVPLVRIYEDLVGIEEYEFKTIKKSERENLNCCAYMESIGIENSLTRLLKDREGIMQIQYMDSDLPENLDYDRMEDSFRKFDFMLHRIREDRKVVND